MTKVIMHGCNGKMGQVISSLIAADGEIEIVAGIDARDEGKNPYPVFSAIGECTVARRGDRLFRGIGDGRSA